MEYFWLIIAFLCQNKKKKKSSISGYRKKQQTGSCIEQLCSVPFKGIIMPELPKHYNVASGGGSFTALH